MLTLDGNLGFWGRVWGFGLNIAKYSRAGGFSSDWLWEGRVKSWVGGARKVQVSVELPRMNNLKLMFNACNVQFKLFSNN